MDAGGKPIQFSGSVDQSGQVWHLPCNGSKMKSPAINHRNMSCQVYKEFSQDESDTDRDMSNSAATRKDAGHIATEIDRPPKPPKVGTWFKKLPAVLEEKDPEDSSEDITAEMVTSEHRALPDDVASLGTPQQMLGNAELAATVIDQLESSNKIKREAIITWMRPAALELALSASGTHVIQKALEVMGGQSGIKLSQCFHGHVKQLLDSPHGNHVLQKMVVVMPPHAFHFILNELSLYSGGWAGVVKHRFGCRVAERLLEHGNTESIVPIVTAVLEDIELFSKHPYANYVVQHILEYVPAHRTQVARALIQVGVPMLAKHKVGSNIVERAFEHGGAESQRAFAEAILSTPNAIVEIGTSRYGSFTVRRMLEALQEPLYYIALQQLAVGTQSLRVSKHGRHVAARVSAALSKMEAERG